MTYSDEVLSQFKLCVDPFVLENEDAKQEFIYLIEAGLPVSVEKMRGYNGDLQTFKDLCPGKPAEFPSSEPIWNRNKLAPVADRITLHVQRGGERFLNLGYHYFVCGSDELCLRVLNWVFQKKVHRNVQGP